MDHLTAKQIVDALGYSENESLYLRMVAFSEGGGTYGDGWNIVPQPINWGAMTAGANWLGSTFEYTDHDAAGKAYVTRFRNYPSHETAAQGLGQQLLKPNVRNALFANDLDGAVHAQIDENGYTGTPPATPFAKYRANLLRVLPQIIRGTGEQNPFLAHPTPISGSSVSSLLASRSLLSVCRDTTQLSVLRRDVGGADVAFWQYLLGGLKIDGWFGPLTEAATMQEQRKLGVKVDGIVGAATWAAKRDAGTS